MPIDIASGNVHDETTELRLPGKVELVWERRFSNALLGREPGWWGPGWTNRFQATLIRHAGGFEFKGPDGAVTLLPDREGQVESGRTIWDPRAYVEVFMRAGRYVVQLWSTEGAEVRRYLFQPGERRARMPLQSIEDLGGEGLDLERDAAGRLESIHQRHEKRRLLLDYTAGGRLASVRLQGPDGQVHAVSRYDYDERGRLVTTLDALEQADLYTYDTNDRLAREVARHGGVASYRYDERGRCVWKGGVNRYDEKHLKFLDATRITEVTDSRGATFRYRALPSGQIAQEWDPFGAVTTTEYDEFGRVVAKVSPVGAVTKYAYDERGNRSEITNAAGSTYRIRFNDVHQPVEVTDPDGQVWSREYDERHRVVASVDPLGGRWLVEYDEAGNAVALTNPRRHTRRCVYEKNILAQASDWMGHFTSLQYDAFGRLRRRTDPLGHSWQYRYDAVGNLVHVQLPDGSQHQASYSPAGDLLRQVDGEGRVTVWRYGPCRRLLQVVSPDGRTVSYAWGTEPDLLERVINERGESYEYTYDEAGRCVEEVGFDGRRMRYRYDAAGRCIAATNGAGETVQIVRDPLGSSVEQKLPDGQSVRFEYDAQGRIRGAVNADCEVRFERDAMGRMVRETQGEHWVAYGLDELGATTQLQTDLGLHLDYELNPNGLWSSLRTHTGAQFRFERDERGQESRRQLPAAAAWAQRHDAAGRVEQQRLVPDAAMVLPPAGPDGWGLADDAAGVGRTYQRDRSGLVTVIDGLPGGRASYAFDPAERLLGVLRDRGDSERYEYDVTGNLTRKLREGPAGQQDERLQYAPGDVLAARGDCRYEHDAQGRLVRRIEAADSPQPRAWTFEWNALDQLRRVTTPDGEVWSYAYDAFSRRIAKRSDREGETRYLWSGHVLIQELRPGDRAPVSHLFAQDSFEPIAQIRDGATCPILTDHLGTPQEMLDAAGRVIWRAQTDAFGRPLQPSVAGAPDCPWHFPGQWFDPESGLHYNRFRYYDPTAGRFISQDPLQLMGGNNLYLYAPNPVAWMDPWGLLCQRLANSLPDGPGIYHIELNGQIYTGSAVNVRSRLSAADHPAAALLNDPNVTVTVTPVGLGTAAGNNRMTNHVLRGYEQGVMNANNNVPLQNGSLNQIRAAAPTRTTEYAQDATNHGATIGTGTSY